MNIVDPKILIIKDNRPGNTNQAVALAKALGGNFISYDINYNIFAKLPNALLASTTLHITNDTLNEIDIDAPNHNIDLIISSGRKNALISKFLKRKYYNNAKLIQIMNPCCSFEDFDIVILPQHDKYTINSNNVLRMIGALNYIENPSRELADYYEPLIKNFIAIIIGGDTKGFKFSEKDIKSFISILLNISSNKSLPLFITFSRRTSNLFKNIIRQYFQNDKKNIIYDPNYDKKPNPYLFMLSKAEYVIATGDSISMCSEIVSSGRPLYIFCPRDFKAPKHRFFIQQLFDLHLANKLDYTTNTLTSNYYQPLKETQRIAQIIKEKLINNMI